MAGEWIAVDLSLPDKPEFQEIMDLTGRGEFEVQGLLIRMWGWASLHCADGTARMTMPRMVRTWGGDPDFWQAVVTVGWLEIDERQATISVPGWDRRFSRAAKARLQHRDRAAAQEEKRGRLRTSAGMTCADAQDIEEIEEIEDSSSSSARARGTEEQWQRIRDAWNAAARPSARYRSARPPKGAAAFLGDAGWLDEAIAAVARLPSCRYFKTPVTLPQLFTPGFVERVLAGGYDSPRSGEPPPPRDDEAFAAARAATLAKLERDREKLHGRLDREAVTP